MLGHHVPEIIAERMYDIFSSKKAEDQLSEASKTTPAEQQAIIDKLKQNDFGQIDENQKVMTFEDLLNFFVVFKKRDNFEMAQVVFHMLCLTQHIQSKQRRDQFQVGKQEL